MLLIAASTLVLTLSQPALQQTIGSGGYTISRNATIPQPKVEILNVDGYPPPLRSRCWWLAGSYALGSTFAGIGGIITESFVRNGTTLADTHNVRTNALGMLIGFVVGAIPGALLGNEARKEENDLTRGVTTLLAIGGTAALGATTKQLFF